MKLLRREAIQQRLAETGNRRLFIDPLLEDSQLGAVSVDLRLGTDFLVSLLTRRPSIDIARGLTEYRGIASYFRPSRRDVGDRFIVYPGQVVLATSLEYIGLPTDVYADIIARSSFNRLGINHNTMMQPGWRGCFPLELFNHGNNPVELVVGGRVVQARLFEIGSEAAYNAGGAGRKYYGSVRPVTSKAQADADLPILAKVRGTEV
jgi:dCTP deaminase